MTEKKLSANSIANRSNAAAAAHTRESKVFTLRKGEVADLVAVNELIAAAMDTWQLSARVKRTSLPVYCYQAHDLEYLQIVVAENVNAVIVGMAAIEPLDRADSVGLSDWSLHGLYVIPNLHRRGIASLLLERIEAMAAAEDASGLLAKARPEAVAFFEARGFAMLPIADHVRDYPHRLYKAL